MAKLPTAARCAIRIRCSPSSATIAIRPRRVSSFGKRADLGEEAAIDLADDLEVARQPAGEEVDRPGLQRFRHQRVERVGERAAAGLPGILPRQPVFVDE